MKKIYLLFFLVVFISCKKQGASPTNLISGTWELRAESNGWTGTKTYAPGNGNIYVFTADHYQIYSNGSLLKLGTYALTKKTSLLQNKVMDAIVFDDNPTTLTMTVEVNGDQLSLAVDAYDASLSIYQKIE